MKLAKIHTKGSISVFVNTILGFGLLFSISLETHAQPLIDPCGCEDGPAISTTGPTVNGSLIGDPPVCGGALAPCTFICVSAGASDDDLVKDMGSGDCESHGDTIHSCGSPGVIGCWITTTVTHLGQLVGTGTFFAALPGTYLIQTRFCDHDCLAPGECDHSDCTEPCVTNSTTANIPCPNTDVSFSKNKITLCEIAKVFMDPPTCVPFTLSIESGADVADLEGNVIRPKKAGSITIKAKYEAADITCTETGTLTISEEACSGGCAEGSAPDSPGTGTARNLSVNIELNPGRGSDQESAGRLLIIAETPSPTLATPASISYDVVHDGVSITRIAGGVIRQVLTAEALVDVTPVETDSGTGATFFDIDFYSFANRGSLNNDVPALYVPNGSPFTTWRIENPDGQAAYNKLKVSKKVGGATEAVFFYTGSNGTKNWTLDSYDGPMTELLSKVEVTWDGLNKDIVTKDPNGTIVAKVREVYQTITFTDPTDVNQTFNRTMLVQTIDGYGTLNRSTTRTYYTDGGYRAQQIKSESFPDGSWVWHNYDVLGRVTEERAPFKGGPVLTDPVANSGVVVVIYEYGQWGTSNCAQFTSPLGESLHDVLSPMSPRSITEIFDGTVTSRRVYAYACADPDANCECADQDRIVIEAQCSGAADTISTSTNLWTVRTYRAENHELLERVDYCDGRRDNYTHETAAFSYHETDPSQFTFEGAGTDSLTTITHETKTYGAISGHSTQEKVYTNWAGRVLYDESFAYVDSTWKRFNWTCHLIDDRGREFQADYSDGTKTVTSWDCCNADSVTSREGVTTEYLRDALGRLRVETINGANGVDYVFVRTYDGAGRLKLVQQSGLGLSQTTSYLYDLLGRVTTETAPGNISTTHLYEELSGGGRKHTITRPGNITEITEYYRDGRIKSVTGSGHVASHYDYGVDTQDATRWTKVYSKSATSDRWQQSFVNRLGQTVSEKRPAFGGNTLTTTNTYDSKGRLTKTNLKNGSGIDVDADTLYVYADDNTHMPNEAIRSGIDVSDNGSLTLDSTDRITESHSHFEPDGDDVWQVSSTVTYPTLDSAAPLTTSTQRSKLTGLGGPVGTGIVTGYSESIDIHGNVTTTTTSLNTSEHKVTQTIDYPDSSTDGMTETVDGLLVTQRSKTGITSYFTYDGLQRRLSASDPRIGFFMTYYNSAGQVDHVMDTAGKHTYFAFDGAGRVSVVTNNDGKVMRYDYNSRGQVTKVWGDSAAPIETHYDDYGQRECMQTYRVDLGWNSTTWPGNGSGDETTWVYDDATGLLTKKIYADESFTEYGYTPEGKLVRRDWARLNGTEKLTTDYDYDAQTGELIDIAYSDDTPDVHMEYKRTGALDLVNDALGARIFTYTDELQPETEVMEGMLNRTLTREYDSSTTGSLGRPTGFSVSPTGGSADYSVGYDHDIKGRLNKVTGPGLTGGGAVYSFVTDSNLTGEVAFKATGGSTTLAKTTRTFELYRDLIDHIENRWIGSGGGAGILVSKYDYANDDLGRRCNVVNSGTAFPSGGRNTVFQYDDRSQLTESRRREGTTPGSGTEVPYQFYQFGYDSIRNRITYVGDQHPEWVKEYISNELNQYTENSTPEYFIYDADGNLIEDADYEYFWDAENRLIAVIPVNPSGRGGRNRRLEFAYDYMGRRIRKVTYPWNEQNEDWEAEPDQDLRFVYDGWNLVQEIDGLVEVGSGVTDVIREYTWGLDLSGQDGDPSPAGVHGAGGIGGLLATRWTNATTSVSDDKAYIYFFNANGDVGQMIDVVSGSSGYGTMAARYEYYPFGGLLDIDGIAAESNTFRFSTKSRDNETGCYYYGYRYLRTKHGRWLSKDRIGEKGGINLYSFVRNSPASSIDYRGMQTMPQPGTHWPGETTIGNGLKNIVCSKHCACKCACIRPRLACYPMAGCIIIPGSGPQTEQEQKECKKKCLAECIKEAEQIEQIRKDMLAELRRTIGNNHVSECTGSTQRFMYHYRKYKFNHIECLGIQLANPKGHGGGHVVVGCRGTCPGNGMSNPVDTSDGSGLSFPTWDILIDLTKWNENGTMGFDEDGVPTGHLRDPDQLYDYCFMGDVHWPIQVPYPAHDDNRFFPFGPSFPERSCPRPHWFGPCP